MRGLANLCRFPCGRPILPLLLLHRFGLLLCRPALPPPFPCAGRNGDSHK
jgi:hypothetical protein